MGFTEKMQVFLIAAWYKELNEAFGERGRQAFVLAVKHYARQRGERMAQRAVRDGQPLNYASYCAYCEWAPSEETLASGEGCVSHLRSTAPDYVYEVYPCVWFTAFKEQNALEAGQLYCRYLDEAIVRGFSSSLQFYTVETQHCADRCVFCIRDADFGPDTAVRRRTEYVKGFDYHCAHTFYAFAETAAGVFGQRGGEMAARVLEAFGAEYGEAMRRQLEAFAGENFDRA